MSAAAMLVTLDEGKLLVRCRSTTSSEREAAFEELFRAYESQVFQLCWRLAGNRAEAEDALQETFLAVFQGLDSFRGEAQLSTWIHRIAVRVALRLRTKPRPQPLVHDYSDAGPTPDERAIAQEERVRLSAAMQQLSAEHRTVLSLFAIGGIAHKEIAAILGVPEGTVWSRLHKARKKLNELLAERKGEEA